jgi:hypothetical protein
MRHVWVAWEGGCCGKSPTFETCRVGRKRRSALGVPKRVERENY